MRRGEWTPLVVALQVCRFVSPRLISRWSNVLDGKLGQICTNFEVKQRKSARMVGIDHLEPGETAPHLVSSITIL